MSNADGIEMRNTESNWKPPTEKDRTDSLIIVIVGLIGIIIYLILK